jgi:hemoglobin
MTEKSPVSKKYETIITPTLKIDHISDSGIERLVAEFYKKIRLDQQLAPIFIRAIAGDWDPHLATMRDFWSSVMMTAGRYKGNPVAKHLKLDGMEAHLFERWLALFAETCNDLFEDTVAKAFIAKAERIAESLELALFYRPDRP